MKQLNRRVYAIVGVIVLLFAGLVYAWSVLSTPIAAEFTGWTKAQLSLTFTLVMILFCIGSLLCGLLAGKLSAKNAVRLGAVLFLAGFYIASVAYLVGTMLFLHVPVRHLVITVGVLAVMIYAVFTLFLKVPLPVGLLFK